MRCVSSLMGMRASPPSSAAGKPGCFRQGLQSLQLRHEKLKLALYKQGTQWACTGHNIYFQLLLMTFHKLLMALLWPVTCELKGHQ